MSQKGNCGLINNQKKPKPTRQTKLRQALREAKWEIKHTTKTHSQQYISHRLTVHETKGSRIPESAPGSGSQINALITVHLWTLPESGTSLDCFPTGLLENTLWGKLLHTAVQISCTVHRSPFQSLEEAQVPDILLHPAPISRSSGPSGFPGTTWLSGLLLSRKPMSKDHSDSTQNTENTNVIGD